MTKTAASAVPSLSDKRPWAQGFNDWLAFGNQANGFLPGEPGFVEYERGKTEAAAWLYRLT